MTSTIATATIQQLRMIFSRFGLPETLVSDNALLKQRCGMHTKKYEMHTIYRAYPWYAVMSYQIWYVMHTIDLSAT